MTKTGVLKSNSDATVITRSTEVVLADGPPCADHDTDHRAEHRADDEESQADPDATAELVGRWAGR